jgi:hypothetical protein
MALHAAELTIDHPITGERLVIAAPVPEDLAAPLRALQLLVYGVPMSNAAVADVANNTVTLGGTTYNIQALGEDQYTVLKVGVPVGRILLSFGAPQGVPEGGGEPMSEDDLYAIGEAWFTAVDAAAENNTRG